MTALLKPALYAQRNGAVGLQGGCCECGYVFFPMQPFGCEKCGRSGESLKPFALSGRGRLVASSLVHVHADAKREAPFVVGTIALDEGPVVRALLTAKTEPAIGSEPVRVVATLMAVKSSEDNADCLDLRFQVVGTQS